MPEPQSITCAQCGISTSSVGALPKFCSHCGAKFESVNDSTGSTDQPDLDETVAPSNSGIGSAGDHDLENTHDSAFVIRRSSNSGKLEPGSQIGPFKLGCQLGAGGMGTVYEAHDTESDCPVALKILSKQVRTTSEGVERFKRESQVAASINHPGSTFVYRSGQYGDQFFIAMELMTGGTLKDIVEEEGPLEVPRAVDFMIQAIDGLAVAHEAGIVHRDFKPSNCFIDEDGHAKVGDFGLAKNFFGDVALTQTGTFVGTPQFAAPEQLRAGHVNAQTDIYAVAGSLFYLLTGRAPFVGDAAQVISGIAAEPAPNIKTIAPHVPEKLAALLASMLEKDPARRPGSLEHIRNALLPFSSLGAVAPDNGQRMAAFFIDSFIFGFISVALTVLLTPLAMFAGPKVFNVAVAAFNAVNLIFWFAGQEYFTGTTIGKWLFKMRVINERNETPKLWQAIARSAMIPGASSILGIFPTLLFETNSSGGSMSVQNMMDIALVEFLQLLAWLPCLLMMLTARIGNGYRGLHDLVTKTRVVRVSRSLMSDRSAERPVTAPLPVDPDSYCDEAIEPFHVLGEMGSSSDSDSRILVGLDPQLNRNVWIYETSEPTPPLSRAAIRPTRQRIIASRFDESCDPHRHYFVAECIEGLPFDQFIETNEPLQWTTFRPLLRELASELEKAADENSLPTDFSTDNVWLDRSGQLKLVEFESGKHEAQDPKDVFHSLCDKIIEQHTVPEHVIGLNKQWRADNVPLSEIVDTLDDLVDRPSSWSWIDRIGATCVSVAVEFAVLILLAQAWVTLCESQFQLSAATICSSFVVAMVAGAFLVGYLFESPVFWFLGIVIRKRNKQSKPSRLRLGFRMVVSWILPILLSAAIIGLQAATLGGETETEDPPIELLIALLTVGLASMSLLAVTLFNLAKPSRGISDLICGTLLMRK